MHDLVRLEERGIASVGVATEPFVDEAVEQARLLALPDCRLVYLPHPVQLLSTEALHAHADAAFGAIVTALLDPGT